MKRVLVLVAVAALAGCGHGARSARVHNGMTKHEVRAVLGKPDVFHRIPYPTPGEMDEGFEDCWDYGTPSLKTSMLEVCFWNGRLTSQTRYGGF